MDDTLVFGIIRNGIENLKARLVRECLMKNGAGREILEMKIFRDCKNIEVWKT